MSSGDLDSALGIGQYDLEDDLWKATAVDGEVRWKVYSLPEPVVVLGRGSKPELELHLDVCKGDSVPLLRRRGGGCSVVVDAGNVLVAASIPAEGIGDNLAHFERLNRWLLRGLEAIDVPGVTRAGTSDLVVGDRKVGGTCIFRTRGVLLYSASLLFSPRLELIERYLKHPPREPDYRAGRPHRDFLASLGHLAGQCSTDEVRARLSGALEGPSLRPR